MSVYVGKCFAWMYLHSLGLSNMFIYFIFWLKSPQFCTTCILKWQDVSFAGKLLQDFALWAARHGNLMCSHQYKRQNLPLSLVIFVVLDWWVDNGLGCLELEQTLSWKGSFCPKLIPAFQLNVKGQSVKGELLSILLLTSYCPTCFLLTTLLFREYFHCYIIGFIPLKTFFLSEQLLLLPTRSFEIQLRAGSSGDAYD